MLTAKPKILIHVCCAICGAAFIERVKENFTPVIFFYNPNIYPESEYLRRRQSAEKLARIHGIKFFEGEYNDKDWDRVVEGFEDEREGGARCPKCFSMRLGTAAKFAKENGFDFFTATLPASPHKDENVINNLGTREGKKYGIEFISMEQLMVNKKENWEKTLRIAKENDFYRQKYCGCKYSMKK